MPCAPALAPLDDRTLFRMLRYALATGADRLQLRPGFRPMVDGPGGARALRFRQLAGDDTAAAAAALLARARRPERLRHAGEGGHALPLLAEEPGEALYEARLAPAPGGLQVAVDVLRALPPGEVVAWLER